MNTKRQKQQGRQKSPFQHFHVNGNYVTQNITIQSGCHVYFTPDGGMPEAQQETFPATPPKDVPQSRIEQAFQAGIRAVLDAGLIQYKQDFRAIHQIMCEMHIYDNFSLNDMITLIDRLVNVPEYLMPTLTSLKKVSFGQALHPDWYVIGVSASRTNRLIKLAMVFKKVYLASVANR